MKYCKECYQKLPLPSFYKHSAMSDGHLNKCKGCVKARIKAHRLKNIERIRAYDRERGNRQPKGYLSEYRARYPLKYKATSMVDNAIRGGKLFREPCEKCGATKNIHGHHDDYTKPLNVRWLCAAHHRQWHVDNGEALNPF